MQSFGGNKRSQSSIGGNGRNSQQSIPDCETLAETARRLEGLQLQIDRIDTKVIEVRQDQMQCQSKMITQMVGHEIASLKQMLDR